jgi:hypothetical protein
MKKDDIKKDGIFLPAYRCRSCKKLHLGKNGVNVVEIGKTVVKKVPFCDSCWKGGAREIPDTKKGFSLICHVCGNKSNGRLFVVSKNDKVAHLAKTRAVFFCEKCNSEKITYRLQITQGTLF